MSKRFMKALLAELAEDAIKRITVPADAEDVMHAFCQAMSDRNKRPVNLVFRTFPPDLPISGLRLELAEQTLIVVAEGMNPQAQVVIFGHELAHGFLGHRGHNAPGMSAAARGVSTDSSDDAVRRAVELVMASDKLPQEAVTAVAARCDSADDEESDAESFGMLLCAAVRDWITGPHARRRPSASTVEGRLELTMSPRGRVL
ncbi:hypothetical protein JCM4814A_01580 [Streptomyces phaeofaciens JCM 4814]|uniref:Toxin-antitoxin system, toxin component n=1 Tax=Streptomyces phaeofaciens TaxID=68254 RepID=A0A918M1F6_9ACTN|nr:toxin [Streptomyces phaeofaciens]GGT94547.1 hypothetical protein GCM10010226_85410 [Streptomyces phaeofaciens]